MDREFIEKVAERVIERLGQNRIALEGSGRHVHLSKEAVEKLFGPGHKLTRKADLSQPGQFSCNERVTLKGPKRTIESVIVLGPERPETQVEISATDALALGVKACVRMSGQLENTPGIKLAGPAGEYEIDCGVIVAKRHIHITPEDAERFGLRDKEEVDVTVAGERAVTFHNVAVRVSPSFATFMHIDYDEANACGHTKDMEGIIHKTCCA